MDNTIGFNQIQGMNDINIKKFLASNEVSKPKVTKKKPELEMTEDSRKIYGEVFGRLITESAIIIFKKSDGTERLLFGTKNMDTVQMVITSHNRDYMEKMLSGYSKRCSMGNGNIAVIDLPLNECRMFNVMRMKSIEWLGEIRTDNQLNEAIARYTQVKKEFDAEKDKGKQELLDKLTF